MNDASLAVILSTILSFLLAIIQISGDAKTRDLRGVFTLSLMFYILIMIIGNVITTLAAASIIDNYLKNIDEANSTNQLFLVGPIWLWYCFFGVFGFEAIIQKINITFFDQGVLSINDWLTKAKKSATAATLDKIVNLDFQDTQKLAHLLIKNKDTKTIHTFASIKFGPEQYQNIIASINNNTNIDQDQYLSYLLSEQFPKEVRAEIKAK